MATLRSGIYVMVDPGKMQLIIEPGIELPTHVYRDFGTVDDNQRSLIIDVLVGTPPLIRPSVRILINDIEPAKRGEAIVEVIFKIDIASQTNLEVRDKRTGEPIAYNMQRYLETD